jgi:RNase P subunit RPR2
MSNDFTHAYCDSCHKIQEVEKEELENEDTTGQFNGGNLICRRCHSILLTGYIPRVQRAS